MDPLVSPLGAGWSGNVYAFAGLNPVGLVDPWGLSPMDASQFAEYRADTGARALERTTKGLADFVDRNAGWIALGVAAVGVAALAVSGPIGWGILGGMAISGGMELGSQLIGAAQGKPIDWKKIAKSASIGGIAGGFGAGVAGVVTKVGSKVFTSVATRYASSGQTMNSQITNVFRTVATNPATRNSAPRMVTNLHRARQAYTAMSQGASSVAQKFAAPAAKEAIAAYSEAGMDTSLTYITDGHHVTADGLASSWGVPAVANALVPKASGKVDDLLRKMRWDATTAVGDNAVRKFTSDRIADFGNGVTAYTAAPMTRSEKYESFKDDPNDTAGWKPLDALNAGFKESIKGGVNSSSHVQSLKAPTFNGWTGLAGDSLFTGAAAPISGEVAELGKQATDKVFGDDKK